MINLTLPLVGGFVWYLVKMMDVCNPAYFFGILISVKKYKL